MSSTHPSHSCRGCYAPLRHLLVDLGHTPLANSYLPDEDAIQREARYPLTAYVCDQCWLVQVPAVETPDAIFSDYAYFSAFSTSWVAHCRNYASQMMTTLSLNEKSLVVEIASNDGTLLTPFHEAGIPVLGIEPAQNIAKHANHKGIPTRALFFGSDTARRLRNEGISANLIAANNVLAHVPDIHDFLAGFPLLLAPGGTITFEFPHVLAMLRETQFDTIYHEHFCYLSLTALMPLFAQHGLTVVDVEHLSTHGGSLRLFVRHAGAAAGPAVESLLTEEEAFGLTRLETYGSFAARVEKIRNDFVAMLRQLTAEGKRIAAYGAPAKGNTLLNYCGITADMIRYTVDLNPTKQGKWLPGSHLPIRTPQELLNDQPDIVVILPWNIAPEIMEQMKEIRAWGGKFLIPIPEVRLV